MWHWLAAALAASPVDVVDRCFDSGPCDWQAVPAHLERPIAAERCRQGDLAACDRLDPSVRDRTHYALEDACHDVGGPGVCRAAFHLFRSADELWVTARACADGHTPACDSFTTDAGLPDGVTLATAVRAPAASVAMALDDGRVELSHDAMEIPERAPCHPTRNSPATVALPFVLSRGRSDAIEVCRFVDGILEPAWRLDTAATTQRRLFPNGRVLSIGATLTLLEAGNDVTPAHWPDALVSAAPADRAGDRVLAATEDALLLLTPTATVRLDGPARPASLAVANTRRAAVAASGEITVYDVKSGSVESRIPLWATGLALDASGRFLAVRIHRAILVLDLDGGPPVPWTVQETRPPAVPRPPATDAGDLLVYGDGADRVEVRDPAFRLLDTLTIEDGTATLRWPSQADP